MEILGRGEFGERTVKLSPKGESSMYWNVPVMSRFRPTSTAPTTAADRERYQTVFARERGSVAAPTAGLHFTPEILDACHAAGAAIARVTLHVGLGTFQPLHTEIIEEVKLHSESFLVPQETIAAMDAASRVVAVGTTSVRAIESDPARPQTELFISPGFEFREPAPCSPTSIAEVESAGAGLRLCRTGTWLSPPTGMRSKPATASFPTAIAC